LEGGVAQVVEQLPSKYEALGSIASITKKKKIHEQTGTHIFGEIEQK
jgi:hypothetical protein